MSGNYPPGVTGGEDYFNPPDHSHEHEWEPTDDYPIFEDGAAMFGEICYYHEGPRHKEWVCEEQRYTRCDVERVVKLREGKPDVTYLASESYKEQIGRVIEEVLETVEWTGYDELNVEQVDPPGRYGDGYVRVRLDGYKVVYAQ